ncbi:unnamed protein product [Prunus armeniaca]|uniref:Uncharacterized protein n=1 Tax=Prunus armeniaca TaxID=36596 RepID=A0A6J5U0C6_PRUAR|nr:unnamed protein product [Prunus armeniaca]
MVTMANKARTSLLSMILCSTTELEGYEEYGPYEEYVVQSEIAQVSDDTYRGSFGGCGDVEGEEELEVVAGFSGVSFGSWGCVVVGSVDVEVVDGLCMVPIASHMVYNNLNEGFWKEVVVDV